MFKRLYWEDQNKDKDNPFSGTNQKSAFHIHDENEASFLTTNLHDDLI